MSKQRLLFILSRSFYARAFSALLSPPLQNPVISPFYQLSLAARFLGLAPAQWCLRPGPGCLWTEPRPGEVKVQGSRHPARYTRLCTLCTE